MKRKSDKKLWLIMSTILSLAAVLVCGISTLSWFQINRPDNTTNLVTASPSINIDSINGYKVEQQLDRNGDAVTYDGNSPTVTKRKSDDSLSFVNSGNTESDTSFDVPSSGVGYYLIKKDTTTGLFKYSNTGTQHFIEYAPSTDSLVSKGYVDSITLNATDVLRVKHYDFQNVSSKVTTIDQQVVIESVSGAGASIVDGDVSIGTEGTYKVWFDYYYKTLTLEKVVLTVAEFNNTDANVPKANSRKPNIKSLNESTPGSNYKDRIYLWLGNVTWWAGHWASSNARIYVYLWDGNSNKADAELHHLSGNDANAIWYASLSSLTWTPTGLKFIRASSSGWSSSDWDANKWDETANVDGGFRTAGNYYKITAQTTAQYNTSDTVYDDSHNYYSKDELYIHRSTIGTDTTITSGTAYTYSLTANETLKVYRRHFKKLFSFADYTKDGEDTWLSASSHITQSTSDYISADGLGNCKANKTFSCKFTFSYTSDLTYTYTFSFYVVTYEPRFFISYTDANSTTREVQLTGLGNSAVALGYAYPSVSYSAGTNLASAIPETQSRADDVNGIYYKFNVKKVKSAIQYYTNEACTTSYSAGTVASDTTIYVKYVTSETSYRRVYLDVSKTYATNENDGSRWQSIRLYSANGATRLIDTFALGNNLYRAFIHIDINQITGTNGFDTYASNNNNWTQNFTISDGECYFVRPWETGHRWMITCTQKNASAGTAKITIDGVDTDMYLGDGTNNKFVYEKGLDIASGKTIVVTMTVNAVITTFDDEDNYVNKDSCSTYLTITDRAITTKIAGKFNFYITGNNKLSIAMVPEKGNGFYIMNYSTTTNSYVGGIKMYGSTNYATYNGFYATSSTRIYIKSYLNAVDKLYDDLDEVASSASVSIQDDDDSAADYGVISFSSPGYYNIEVSNATITIKGYTFSDFFKLDRLNTKTVDEDDSQDVWNQLTSLILEVEFTLDTPVGMNIDLIVDNPLSAYVGVGLFVKASTALSNPYEDMRGATYGASGNHYSLFSSSVISPSSTFTTTVGVTKYFAYIIIDYLPVAGIDNLPSTVSNSLSFYLRATQA